MELIFTAVGILIGAVVLYSALNFYRFSTWVGNKLTEKRLRHEDSKIQKDHYEFAFGWIGKSGTQQDLLFSHLKGKFMQIEHRSNCVH